MHFVKATHIFDGKQYLPEGKVLVMEEDGNIKEIVSEKEIDALNVESFDGIITPGFINTHCHLELSHLKNKIAQHTGIVDFGLSVIKHRNDASQEIQEECMRLADAEMKTAGIVAVGDISNTNATIKAKQNSDLYYHTFVELIALNPQRSDVVMEQGNLLLNEFQQNQLSVSLAPHAPYTASVKLIHAIVEECKKTKKATSIHNQESKTENEFFISKSGDYVRLYETLNIPIDYFEPSGSSSLQSVLSGFDKNVNTLLVHNTFSSPEDISLAQKTLNELYWCLCPKANLYIENTLPDLNLLLAQQCQLTIGTDSLASNNTLSIIEEINLLLKHFPSVPLEALLKAATYTGAKFLGIEDQFGTIEKNKKPGINLIEKKGNDFSAKRLF